ncbi:MAG TPA: F0F1 ATP synthase subunit epsilon [Spirochaetia bacterium]|nr:F0F1 ATP synthase subunit epsilon [Spirochaetia bacterium]
MAFTVEIVSAERAIWSGSAEFIVVPGSQGELGIHGGHAPLLTYMKSGNVAVHEPGGEVHHFYVSGGVAEIQPAGVIILSDASVRAQDLDEAQILQAKAEAEDMLRNKKDKLNYGEIELRLSQEISKLQTLEKYRAGRK